MKAKILKTQKYADFQGRRQAGAKVLTEGTEVDFPPIYAQGLIDSDFAEAVGETVAVEPAIEVIAPPTEGDEPAAGRRKRT